jgi:hypothetical protein
MLEWLDINMLMFDHIGMYSNATDCTGCKPGFFQSNPGKSACVSCGRGTYSNKSLSRHCDMCPTGYRAERLEAAVRCLACGVGEYQENSAQTACKECGMGKITSTAGSAFCTACLAGMHSNSNVRATGCVKCLPGTYQDDSGKTACAQCTPGQIAPHIGTRVCIACLAGKYVADVGNATYCTACKPGHYGNLNNRNRFSASHCHQCPAGKMQRGEAKTRCLDALRAAYIKNNKEYSCPSSLRDEAVCEFGKLSYKDGFWHDGLTSKPTLVQEANGTMNTKFINTNKPARHRYSMEEGYYIGKQSKFYRCRGLNNTCTSHSNGDGSIICSEGNTGILCGICRTGYTPTLFPGGCEACSVTAKDWIARGWLFAIVFFSILIVVRVAATYLKVFVTHGAILHELKDTVSSKFKIANSFFQVVLLLGAIYDINWPPEFLEFLNFFSVFEFDFLRIFKLACFVNFDAHSTLYGLSAVLLVLEIIVIAGLVSLFWAKKRNTAQKYQHRIQSLLGWVLLITYFVYPFGCKSIFGIFNCIEVDGVRYLRADLQVECHSAQHQAAEGFAWFMILLFPVGLPLLYFFMLFVNRHHLYKKEEIDGIQQVSDKVIFLRFFFGEYEPQYYYWETVECIRKCVLMGFASFFKPGSLLQLIVVIILTVLYTIFLTQFTPCKFYCITLPAPTINNLLM